MRAEDSLQNSARSDNMGAVTEVRDYSVTANEGSVLNGYETYNPETLKRHRRATLRALMLHGDMMQPTLTLDELADRIGLPVNDLRDYINNDTPPRYVDGFVARFLSVPIKHWNKGKPPISLEGVDNIATT